MAADPFLYDPLYYDTYYDYWREYSLPSAKMIELALPEGTVRPGGEVTGFLYFEEIPGEVPGARFEMELVNAATGRQVGRISIPFVEADV